MSDHRCQIEISLHTVIHTRLGRSTSLIPEDASNFLITIASGPVSRFADLSPAQTSVGTHDRTLYCFRLSLWLIFRNWEALSTDSPGLVFGIYRWGALATSQLFNRLDRYLRPKSLQKMRREERANLMTILYWVFIGVCSTPPPTRKTAQESLDSLKQVLLAYIHYITPNTLLDPQFNRVTSMAISLYAN